MVRFSDFVSLILVGPVGEDPPRSGWLADQVWAEETKEIVSDVVAQKGFRTGKGRRNEAIGRETGGFWRWMRGIRG